MSWDVNHIVLIGRLTRDPELTYTQSGAAVCRFSIAVNRTSGSRGENQEESTSFFNIVAWNKTAEICKEYLNKGKQVAVDGRLQQRRWTATDGTKRSNIEIVANTVQFLGSSKQTPDRFQAAYQDAGMGDEAGSFPGESPPDFESGSSGGAEDVSQKDPFLSELDDDEIPF